MGYTHYWRRPRVILPGIYSRIVDDFNKTAKELAKYVDLADGNGKGRAWIDKNTGQVHFNGRKDCGHPENKSIVIPWPAPEAGGVAEHGKNKPSGSWFAGAEVETRMCNGSCDYESFIFDRDRGAPKDWERPEEGLYFDFCKTAFRPYDLAVVTFLIIAKRHLGKSLKVSSDGEDQHWFDGKMVCQTVLGYGLDYQINKDGELVAAKVEVR